MSKWYYAAGGREHGPVSTDELKSLFEVGTVQGDTLIWNESFGAEWTQFSKTQPASSNRPPPLPGSPPPPSASVNPNQNIDEFLESEALKALIGPRHDYYKRRFRSILERSGQTLPDTVKYLRTPSSI